MNIHKQHKTNISRVKIFNGQDINMSWVNTYTY